MTKSEFREKKKMRERQKKKSVRKHKDCVSYFLSYRETVMVENLFDLLINVKKVGGTICLTSTI